VWVKENEREEREREREREREKERDILERLEDITIKRKR